MNILAIGNSFSEDATRYLYDIARANGENLSVINLYVGGCPLDEHYRNMLSDNREYALEFNGQRTGFSVSLSEALLNREWDVITLQQVSNRSFKKESFEPYLSELMAYARKCSPKAKIYLHQTWAYEDGSHHLLNTAKYEASKKMLDDIVKTYREVSASVGADGIIPSGEMFGALASLGVKKLHRDGAHASLGIGRYALGLIWYRALFGKTVTNNSFCDFDEPISEEDIQTIKAAADSFNLV